MNNNEDELQHTSASKRIRVRFDHDAAKQTLREKYESKLLFAAYNGMWKAGPELLSILNLVPAGEVVVIVDEYGNPCQVPRDSLFAKAYERWQEQMNGWFIEYQKLSRIR